jgi:arabinofuranosyltransferase
MRDALRIRSRCAAILSLAVVAPACFFAVTLDDAFITFRYAENLANGHGYGVWNPGEAPVEGFTSPLWMVMLACCAALGVDVETAAKLLGWAAHVGAVAIVIAAAVVHERDPDASALDRNSAWVAALFHAALVPAIWYATSGMETSLVAFAVTWAMWHPILSRRTWSFVAASVLLTVLRPEGFVFAVCIATLHAWRRRDDRVARAPYVAGLVAAVGTMALLLGVRLFVFGEWMANTYYAKGTGPLERNVVLGAAYDLEFAAALLPVWLPALLTAHRARREPVQHGVEKLAYVLVLVVAIAMIKVGGDASAAFPFFRQFVHTVPAVVYVAARGLCRCMRPGRRSFATAGLIASLVALSTAQWHKERVIADVRESFRAGLLRSRPETEFHAWLRAITFDDTVTAVSAAGQWPYRARRGTFVDMLGLSDRHIAHHGSFDSFARVDSKTDIDYVMSRAPDVIDGYLPALPILQGLPRERVVGARAEMIDAILDHPEFIENYELVVDAPYHAWAGAVFIRRDYLQRLPDDLQPSTVDVRATSLY